MNADSLLPEFADRRDLPVRPDSPWNTVRAGLSTPARRWGTARQKWYFRLTVTAWYPMPPNSR